VSGNDLYYDPYDRDIDVDPYPIYRRLRDEAPLYYNERYDFWGVSRFADVEEGLKDSKRLSSAKGDILEVVKADPVMPPGVFINEDPPLHTIHRALVSRAFTPRKMKALEEKVRAFCASCLDAVLGAEQFDFVHDIGAEVGEQARAERAGENVGEIQDANAGQRRRQVFFKTGRHAFIAGSALFALAREARGWLLATEGFLF